ncbi:tyrosine-type recombinase/integrase [Metabacillus herbersteinensis]|uniref:Tyrosine-type recombinase/integrase n=1 Tax=Metabacillus herbersteinensis TaxID=283816 RepID=A0ABV6GLF9_9BACI
MPFGYSLFLKSSGKSENTITGYIKTINSFLYYLDTLYGKQRELYEITPSDIKSFLKYKIDEGNNIKTTNKQLATLKGFFDYLWINDKVPIDPAVKIKRYTDSVDEKISNITYEMLLKTLREVNRNSNYSVLRKVIFLLATKGLRGTEFQFHKDSVIDHGDSVELKLKKHSIILDGEDAGLLLNHYYESQFNGSTFVFVTKKHDESIVPIELMSIYTHLNAITEDYGYPDKITLNTIRHAFAYYLYTKKRFSIEQVANLLGIENNSAAQLIRNSVERHMKKEVLEIQ